MKLFSFGMQYKCGQDVTAHHCSGQGLANHGLWAKCGSLSVFAQPKLGMVSHFNWSFLEKDC